MSGRKLLCLIGRPQHYTINQQPCGAFLHKPLNTHTMNTTFSTNRLGGVTFKGTDSSTLNEIWLSGRHYEVLEYTSEKQTIDQYNAALRSIGSGYHLEPSDDDSGISKEAVVADSILSNYNIDSSDNVDIDYNELREILIDIQG